MAESGKGGYCAADTGREKEAPCVFGELLERVLDAFVRGGQAVVTDPQGVYSMLRLGGLLFAFRDHALVKILLSVRGFGRAGARLGLLLAQNLRIKLWRGNRCVGTPAERHGQ